MVNSQPAHGIEQARDNEWRRALLLVALRDDLQQMAQHLTVTLGTLELPKEREQTKQSQQRLELPNHRLSLKWESDIRATASQQRLELPNHRLSSIVNSFAWHVQRTQPAARLACGIAEIKRLQQRVERNSAEYNIYAWLLNQIGSAPQPGSAEQQLLDPLYLADNEIRDWLAYVRLLRAEGLVQLLGLITRARPVAEEIAKAGGALRWS
jgi:hypothetical protein